MLHHERECWQRKYRCVAGVDEAGRGPLAGPVVAAAVVFDAAFVTREADGLLAGLTDSKQLSAARRELFFDLLDRLPDVSLAVGIAGSDEIDRFNILRATYIAMARAVSFLACRPDHVLVDGRSVEGLPVGSTAIVGGDGISLSIAAASVVAKVVRDRIMAELAVLYPRYGFEQHKGYGTRQHLQALFEYGPCPAHRRSFRPVREAAEIRRRTADMEPLP